MIHPVDAVLAERLELVLGRRRWPSVVTSFAIHLAGALAVVVAPMLAARGHQPPQFVAVRIVPVQALGVPEPAPRAPAAAETERPAPAAARLEAEVEKPSAAAVRKPAEPAQQPPPKPAPAPATAVEPDAERPTDAGPATPTEGTKPERRGSPTGSPLATSPFGAAVAGLDNPDFTYGYYVDQMLAMIGSSWVRPPLGGEIEATIYFRIERDGRVSALRILSSSGYNQFDLAGLRAIQAAAPFPPLPRGYRHDTLGVNLIFK